LAVQSAVGWVDESAVLRVVCLAVYLAFGWDHDSAVLSGVGWVDQSAFCLVSKLGGRSAVSLVAN